MNVLGIEIKIYCFADPNDIDDQVIGNYPGNYNDLSGPDIEFFFDVIEDIVLSNFLKGLMRFKLSLRKKNIREITIGYDLLGLKRSKGDLAGYCLDFSDPANGSYHLFAFPSLMVEYAENFWENTPIRPEYEYAWEHELIHMLDHENIKDGVFEARCTDGRKIFMDFLLNFRSEGIADLIYLFRNQRNSRSMTSAKKKFKELLSEMILMDCNMNRTVAEIRQKLLIHDFYLIGSWMIIHVLGCPAFKDSCYMTDDITEMYNSGKFVGDLFIYRLIYSALRTDIHDFIRHITAPGCDGQPFVDEFLLAEAADAFSNLSFSSNSTDLLDEKCAAHTNDYTDSQQLLTIFNEFWGASVAEVTEN